MKMHTSNIWLHDSNHCSQEVHVHDWLRGNSICNQSVEGRMPWSTIIHRYSISENITTAVINTLLQTRATNRRRMFSEPSLLTNILIFMEKHQLPMLNYAKIWFAVQKIRINKTKNLRNSVLFINARSSRFCPKATAVTWAEMSWLLIPMYITFPHNSLLFDSRTQQLSDWLPSDLPVDRQLET